MATLPPIHVNGDGTGPRDWGFQPWGAIDDSPSTPDSVVIQAAAGTDLNVTSFTLDAMPADFASMDSATFRVRYGQTGRIDDTVGLEVRIVAADGTTVLAGAFGEGWTTVSGNITANLVTSATVPFSTVTPANKVTWDGAQVQFRQRYTKAKGMDNALVKVDAFELTGTYTAAVAAVPSGGFDVTDTATVAWSGGRPSSGGFAAADTATVGWSAARGSSGGFPAADAVDVGWTGVAPADAPASGGFAVADDTSVAWSAHRPSAGGFTVASDGATVEWTGVRVSSGTYPADDATAVTWAGVTGMSGGFAADDAVTVSWTGDAPLVPGSGGAFAVSDVATMEWSGTAPQVPAAGGSFAATDDATVQWSGYISTSGGFAADDDTTVQWSGHAPALLVAAGGFAVADDVTVQWTGSAPPSQVEHIPLATPLPAFDRLTLRAIPDTLTLTALED